MEELAEALELTPDKVRNLLKLIRFPLSLEAPTDTEEDSVLGDFIEDEEAPGAGGICYLQPAARAPGAHIRRPAPHGKCAS